MIKKIGAVVFTLLIASPAALSADTLGELQAQVNALLSRGIPMSDSQVQNLLGQIAQMQNSGVGNEMPLTQTPPAPLPPTAPIAPVTPRPTPPPASQADDYGTGVKQGTVYCPKLSQTIEKGARDNGYGGQVSELQAFLTSYFNLDENVVVGGYFGKLTQKYLMQFQQKNGLPAYGIAGSLTRTKINEICKGVVRSVPDQDYSAENEKKSTQEEIRKIDEINRMIRSSEGWLRILTESVSQIRSIPESDVPNLHKFASTWGNLFSSMYKEIKALGTLTFLRTGFDHKAPAGEIDRVHARVTQMSKEVETFLSTFSSLPKGEFMVLDSQHRVVTDIPVIIASFRSTVSENGLLAGPVGMPVALGWNAPYAENCALSRNPAGVLSVKGTGTSGHTEVTIEALPVIYTITCTLSNGNKKSASVKLTPQTAPVDGELNSVQYAQMASVLITLQSALEGLQAFVR